MSDTSITRLFHGHATSAYVAPGVTLHIDGYRLMLDTPRGRQLLSPAEHNLNAIYNLATLAAQAAQDAAPPSPSHP